VFREISICHGKSLTFRFRICDAASANPRSALSSQKKIVRRREYVRFSGFANDFLVDECSSVSVGPPGGARSYANVEVLSSSTNAMGL